MPDHMCAQDYERKLEDISIKLFEASAQPKKNRSNIRTSYRTDFSKTPVINFNDHYSFFNYEDQMLLSLASLTESLKIVEPLKQYPVVTRKSKKSVRFADAVGCAMLKVIEFLPYPNEDENKMIDSDESFSSDGSQDLDLDTFEVENIRSKWKCCFEQPGLNPNFYQELQDKKVRLEFVHVNHNILDGTVRVINLAQFKRVTVRVTFNEWKSYIDVTAEHVKSLNFNHVLTDQFKYSVELDKSMISQLLEENKCTNTTDEPIFRVQFAICLEAFSDSQMLNGLETYWDNNDSKNFCFESYLQMII
jgi:hypothetical protein